MDNRIFRKKSIDRVSSPDQLDMYIKASGPRLWLLLTALLLLLAGALVWAVFGTLETRLTVGVIAGDGTAAACVPEQALDAVTQTAFLRVEGMESPAAGTVAGPFAADDAGAEESYALHASGIGEGEWYYLITFPLEGLPEGSLRGELVLEKLSPITFIIN